MTSIPIQDNSDISQTRPESFFRFKAGKLQQLWSHRNRDGQGVTWKDVPIVADDAPDDCVGPPWE